MNKKATNPNIRNVMSKFSMIMIMMIMINPVNTYSLTAQNIMDTDESLIVQVPFKRYFVQPGDMLNVDMKVSVNRSDITAIRSYIESESIYLPSKSDSSWIKNPQQTLSLPFSIAIPQDIPYGLHKVKIGVETDLHNKIGMELSLRVIDSGLTMKQISLVVKDNLDQPRPVTLSPSLTSAGTSGNLSLQPVTGTTFQLPLLANESYDFQVKDLRSGVIKTFSGVIIDRDNITLDMDLFDVIAYPELDGELLTVTQTITNNLEPRLEVVIQFLDENGEIKSSAQLPLLFGKSQYVTTIPTNTNIHKIVYRYQDIILEEINLDITYQQADQLPALILMATGLLMLAGTGVGIVVRKKGLLQRLPLKIGQHTNQAIPEPAVIDQPDIGLNDNINNTGGED